MFRRSGIDSLLEYLLQYIGIIGLCVGPVIDSWRCLTCTLRHSL